MRAITSEKIPTAIGPYSAAVIQGSFIFTSGQLGIDPQTSQFVGDSIKEQTRQALENLRLILEAENCTLQDIVKVTIFLADINDYSDMNEVYASFFNPPYPARSAFQVACLPRNALVEIEAIVLRE